MRNCIFLAGAFPFAPHSAVNPLNGFSGSLDVSLPGDVVNSKPGSSGDIRDFGKGDSDTGREEYRELMLKASRLWNCICFENLLLGPGFFKQGWSQSPPLSWDLEWGGFS